MADRTGRDWTYALDSAMLYDQLGSRANVPLRMVLERSHARLLWQGASVCRMT
jgi:dTDP-D-glucose 4,6-dehydratase